MATSLIVDFIQDTGTTRRLSWSNIDPEAPASAIRSFVQGVVTNSGAILNSALTSAQTAVLRTTTDTAINLNP